jgi:hypothetical protein
MSDRKLHISLTEEHFQAARKCAFDAETSISHVIGYLVQKCLIEKVLSLNATSHRSQQNLRSPR